MSEYQYFEFLAIDRPLTDREMDTLRSYSTRAHITRTSFVNEYNWGRFKGDADEWMKKYFDVLDVNVMWKWFEPNTLTASHPNSPGFGPKSTA